MQGQPCIFLKTLKFDIWKNKNHSHGTNQNALYTSVLVMGWWVSCEVDMRRMTEGCPDLFRARDIHPYIVMHLSMTTCYNMYITGVIFQHPKTLFSFEYSIF